MSCGVGHRRGSDPVLLCLWCRPVAIALIVPPAWEPPCATGVALEKGKKKKKDKIKIFKIKFIMNILNIHKMYLNIYNKYIINKKFKNKTHLVYMTIT